MSTDDRIRAIERAYPERIPISAHILPAAWMKYREDLQAIVDRHPLLFGESRGKMDYDYIERGTFVEGHHKDAWGCIWSNVKTGMQAIVTQHPVQSREDVHSLQIPDEDDGIPHGFMYLRLADLRGFEELMVDFAEEPPELQILIDKVLEYNLRQIRKRVEGIGRDRQIVSFGDDLGMQHSLPMSPEKWRQYLKPCFKRIYGVVKDAGHYVYMHTDGHVLPIIGDLIDCGVDVINPQVGANGLLNLHHACGSSVCVDLDLNRQMFPFWTPDEIDQHVRESVETLGSREGGLWLKAEIADDVPLTNVEAIFTALEKYSTYYS